MPDKDLVAAHIEALREDMSEVKASMSRMAEAMERLARIEERQSSTNDSVRRAFVQLENHDKRIQKLEESAPINRLVSGWVITGVVACIGLLVALLLKSHGVG